jgi:hypothetical protein
LSIVCNYQLEEIFMVNAYKMLCDMLENAAAGMASYESLPTGKPLKIEDTDSPDQTDMSARVQKIRNELKEKK